jgi:hypothetical protein
MAGFVGGGPRVDGIPVVASSAFSYAGEDAARFVGDLFSLSVVDLDDVLGGGAGAVISEYVSRLPVPPWDYAQSVESPTAGAIPEGLYLVVEYENSGSEPVDLGVTWRWFLAG